jgi:prepilin-type N-terminal cleavage/methylation domain-containing protein
MLAKIRERNLARGMSRSESGFTLLEILIVLAILALIMGLLIGPKILKGAGEAQKKTLWMGAKNFEQALVKWRLKNPGKPCPSSLGELVKEGGPEEYKTDEGKELYVMYCGSNAPEGASLGYGFAHIGDDGKAGTDDDIKSWEKSP